MTHNMDSFKDELSLNLHGRALSIAKANRQCVACGDRADIFNDDLSYTEYFISGLCQMCQDDYFAEPEE